MRREPYIVNSLTFQKIPFFIAITIFENVIKFLNCNHVCYIHILEICKHASSIRYSVSFEV